MGKYIVRHASAQIWRWQSSCAGTVVAMSRVRTRMHSSAICLDSQRTYREINILQELKGDPNIVKLVEIIPGENGKVWPET